MQLLKTPSVHRITQKANSKNVIYVAPPTVRKMLLFEREMDEEGLISWLLSCRDNVTVLEPQSVREKLRKITSEIGAKYQEQEEK